jgi:thiamine pyrophosphokinase
LDAYRRAIIVANGRLERPQEIADHLQPGDLLIAADGGARHLQKASLLPHVLIGDFDSLEAGELQALEHSGVKVVQHPARKDYTDLELALRYAAQNGMRHALVFGALGGRWDQSLANLLIAAAPGLEHLEVALVDGAQRISLLRGGQRRTLHGQPGETVSLLPVGGEAVGIHTQGLEYPLHGEDLHFGATRGISNTLLAAQAQVSLQRGLLLLVQAPANVDAA